VCVCVGVCVLVAIMISLEQYRVVIGLHNLRHHNHVRLSLLVFYLFYLSWLLSVLSMLLLFSPAMLSEIKAHDEL